MALANQNSSRAKALARRKAMSTGGKSAVSGQGDRTRSAPALKAVVTPTAEPAAAVAPVSSVASAPRASVAATASVAGNSSRAKSLARRKAMSSRGKTAAASSDRTRDANMVPRSKLAAAKAATTPAETQKADGCGCGCKRKAETATTESALMPKATAKARTRANKPRIAANPGKAAALARRKAQSTRGKAGISAAGMSQAQTARAANPDLSSRELAQSIRETRSTRGKTCSNGKCRPTGKVRKQPEVVGAADQPWKVGASETAAGQTVTGTMTNRDKDVTGNEASTCRAITGTEYMGADVFREFCQTDPMQTPSRSGTTVTSSGNSVTGNRVGRSEKVTGDEPGTCKNVTGTEYVGAGQTEAFCGTKPTPGPMRKVMSETRKGKTVTGDNVGSFKNVTGGEAGAQRDLTGAQYMKAGEAGREPAKVRISQTLRGGSVTGTAVGRSEKTTGDEAGSCRNITGDDYVGQEQYSNCGTMPEATDQKVGVSTTLNGLQVTGTMNDRGKRVTGNEPGTCKAVTGTPYAGAETYAEHCEAPSTQQAAARMQRSARNTGFGMNMTGLQPGIGGKLTGAGKGACEPLTGTPYVGAGQMAEACPATAETPASTDFPQAAGETGWGGFSVTPPSHAAAIDQNTGVTGSRYEQGHITGPFGMANGKVTGTEDARFGSGPVNSSSVNEEPAEPQEVAGRVKSRITGEGQDGGQRITGDDWARGEHVTGTEGSSAMARNMTRRGAMMNAMMMKPLKEVQNAAPEPISKVTGSSGNYENGSLITYSGGARG